MIGSNNKLNNALATILALASYKHADYFSSLRVVKAIEGKDEEVKEEKPAKKAAPKTEKAEKSEEKKAAKKSAPKVEKEEAKEEKPAKKAPVKKATKKEEK